MSIPGGMGELTVNATQAGSPVVASVQVIAMDTGVSMGTYNTPFSFDVGTIYGPVNVKLTATYQGVSQTQNATVTTGQQTTVNFQFVSTGVLQQWTNVLNQWWSTFQNWLAGIFGW